MKKITFILSCLVASVGVMQAQQVQLPAAYNNPASVLEQDNVAPADRSSGYANLDAGIPFTGTYGDRRTDLIYDNGPHFNTPGTGGGFDKSILETSLGMNTLGAGAQFTAGNSMADDVTLVADFDITSMDFYVYQTGSVPPSITEVYVQIWDGDPSDGTANIVWGDLTVDILEDVVAANTYRASETSPNDTSRPLQKVTAATDNLTLTAGTYWIECSFAGSGGSGPWAPPIAILGQSSTGNALQNTGTDGWQAWVDSGSFTPQGLPFQIYGTPNLSVKDNALAGFSFYPNPTRDLLNLSANKNIESISFFNLLGQKVMNATVGATTSNINLSGLATGAYMMEVTIDGQKGVYKIMKN